MQVRLFLIENNKLLPLLHYIVLLEIPTIERKNVREIVYI